MLKFVLAFGIVLVVVVVVVLSPWNLYQVEGWAHCTACHSVARASYWILGNPDGDLLWTQDPQCNAEPPRRAQLEYFDSSHKHEWEIDNHWFCRLGFMAPHMFTSALNVRNEFAIKYNQEEPFGDWIDHQVVNGEITPEVVRTILRSRDIDLEKEVSDLEDQTAILAWRLFEAYRSEIGENSESEA